MTNCENCKWSYSNHCRNIGNADACTSCDNYNQEQQLCKCLLGTNYVDCEYFEEINGGNK